MPPIFRRVGDDADHRGVGGDVLAELFRVNLIERVVGGVVQVEIVGAVLLQGDRRDAALDKGGDVGAAARDGGAAGGAERGEGGFDAVGDGAG